MSQEQVETADDPMQPLLTGFLLACLDGKGREVMKIVKFDAVGPTGFKIIFASGLELVIEVNVS